MKKVVILMIGLCFVNHAFAAAGAAKSLSREELELRLLAAQVEKAQAEAREAVAKAEIAESEAASKKHRAHSGITAAAARVPGVRYARTIHDIPHEPSALAVSAALAYPRF
jgi:hypothetical protein